MNRRVRLRPVRREQVDVRRLAAAVAALAAEATRQADSRKDEAARTEARP